MTQERFYITDTGLGIDTISDETYDFCNAEDFCRLFDLLNAFCEDKKNLVIDCDNLINDNTELTREVNYEYKENQHLKRFIKRLYDSAMESGQITRMRMQAEIQHFVEMTCIDLEVKE